MATSLAVKMRSPDVMDIFAGILGNDRLARSYVATALITVANNEDLQACSAASIIKAATQAATLRLSVDPTTREAWLIPRNNKKKVDGEYVKVKEASFQIGYQGYYKMAMRTELYRYIQISRLPAGWNVRFDTFTGAPEEYQDEKSEGGVVGSFALYKGFSKTVFWTFSDLETHRKKYAPYNKVWVSDREAMEEKTVGTDLLKNWGVFTDGDKLLIDSFDTQDAEADKDPETYEPEHQGAVVDGELAEVAEIAAQAKTADDPKEPEAPIDERNWTDTKLNWLVSARIAIDVQDASYILGLSPLEDNSTKSDVLFWAGKWREQKDLGGSTDVMAALSATNIHNREIRKPRGDKPLDTLWTTEPK